MPIEPLDICYLLLALCSLALIGEMLSHKSRRVLVGIGVVYAVTAVATVQFANAQYEVEQDTRDAVTARYDVDLPRDADDWRTPFEAVVDGEDVVCDLDGDGEDARLRCGALDEATAN